MAEGASSNTPYITLRSQTINHFRRLKTELDTCIARFTVLSNLEPSLMNQDEITEKMLMFSRGTELMKAISELDFQVMISNSAKVF